MKRCFNEICCNNNKIKTIKGKQGNRQGTMMDEKEMFMSTDIDDQFAISYEILCLLRWLVDNEPEKLKRMITRAAQRGLKEKMNEIKNFSEKEALADAHENMIEFFSILEAMLEDTMDEETTKTAFAYHLLPALAHIDAQVCGNNLIRESLEKIDRTRKNDQRQPQEILLQEILKQWKPSKRTEIH